MKRTHLICLCLLLAGSLKSQNLKPVTLIEQRSYHLNGGINSTFNDQGASRVAIKIDLPPNTRKWYYSFSTSADDSGTKLLNLGLQIAQAASTGGLSVLTSSAITVPAGSGTIDAYIMPLASNNAFLRKDDNKCPIFQDASIRNVMQAVQTVTTNVGNSVCLGIKNLSYVNAVNVYVEVVALVGDANAEADKGTLYGSLGWKAYEKGEFDKCLELSNKALTYNPDLGFVKFNIALVHLLQEKAEALDEYISAIAAIKTDSNPKYLVNGALQDIRQLKAKRSGLKNLTDIEELLMNEFRKY
jgi:tetratricopeptide (TPR) repeat protein